MNSIFFIHHIFESKYLLHKKVFILRFYNYFIYSEHRKKSYPHTHAPLKSMHSRSMRRRLTSPRVSESDIGDVASASLAEVNIMPAPCKPIY